MRKPAPYPSEIRFKPHRDYRIDAIGSIGFSVELDAHVYVKKGVEYIAKIFGELGGERASVTLVNNDRGKQ